VWLRFLAAVSFLQVLRNVFLWSEGQGADVAPADLGVLLLPLQLHHRDLLGASSGWRVKPGPAQRGDDVLPDRTLAQRDAAYLDETKHRQAELAGLKEQAQRERKELEALRG
jgi:hypothetical protein